MANKLVSIKERLENILEYWNNDRNDAAMYDALLHIEDTVEELFDDVDELSTSSILDYDWRYCDEFGLPERTHEMGGSGFSDNVFVTDGKRFWTDSVIYPHGIYGGDMTPKFCQVDTNNRKVVAWMNIPSLQPKGDIKDA